jgi:hypothetical protein
VSFVVKYDAFADLDELHGPGGRMALDLAALGPFIGLIVMVDIGEQKA